MKEIEGEKKRDRARKRERERKRDRDNQKVGKRGAKRKRAAYGVAATIMMIFRVAIDAFEMKPIQ